MKKAPKKFIQKEEQNSAPVFAKASAGKQKSPSIPRKIPESASSSWVSLATIRTHAEVILVSFISGVLLMGIGLVGVELQKNHEELKRREALHQALSMHQQYWRGIVSKYPDYKDAYLQLAIVSYQLGDADEAKGAIGKVLEIDPNDATGQEFARKIRG